MTGKIANPATLRQVYNRDLFLSPYFFDAKQCCTGGTVSLGLVPFNTTGTLFIIWYLGMLTRRAVLNLAVDMDRLDKNLLKWLPVQEYVKRERVAEGWELLKIRKTATSNVWRLVMCALQAELRENKAIEIHEEWLVQRADGW